MRSDLFITGISLDRKRLSAEPPAPEDMYIVNLPAVKNLSELKFNSPVTFFVGENGTGKSTLIEAVAINCGFNPEGGSRNFNFSTRGSHSALHQYLNVSRGLNRPRDGYFLRAESFYNVATNLESLDKIPAAAPKLTDGYGGLSLHEMSHGESFFALMKNRFFGGGLYILDEPEAALSPSRVMAMISLIGELCGSSSELHSSERSSPELRSQFIISTHSPILLAYPDAEIYELQDDGIKLTPYRETETFRATKQFLDNPERMVKYLTE